ncbi:protein phosphatase 1, regulatory subunit 13Ba isoform X1, partial [Tachysurus ichikawai]
MFLFSVLSFLPQISIPVYLSSSKQVLTEVPIGAETRCKDVVEFCREVGESGCHLVHVCRGKESLIPSHHLMMDYLQKWGQRRQEVKFYLQRENEHSRK